MKLRSFTAALPAAVAALALSMQAYAHGPAGAAAPGIGETVAPAYQYALPNMPGKTITALTVDYAPGGKSQPHRHGKAYVVAYVLAGSIRSKVDNGPERVYKAGESWTELPGAHHVVSENASTTEPARLMAVFIADTSQKELVTWDKK